MGFAIGKQILDLAERADDSNLRVEGHFVLGTSYIFTGIVDTGLMHLEKATSYIDPKRRRSSRYRLGNYPGISCYTSMALILWALGYPDQALLRAKQAVDLANKVNHPYSLAYALFHTGFLHYWRREAALSMMYAQAVLEVSEKHEFQIWHAVGACLLGASVASQGRAEEGLAQIEGGMDMYQELKSPPIFLALLRNIQAGACGLAGKTEQGLALIDEVLALPSLGFGRVLTVDFYRLKGDLYLAHPQNARSEAERCYLNALEISREQRVPMLELRAALSLARLWGTTGQAERGREMLKKAYAKLGEGFTIPDLIEARDLLNN
jgi:tetratricopeptide (TPR) repeat protein